MGVSRDRVGDLVALRAAAVAAIVGSDADKKLIVAGPGTGKTHTFKEALRACRGRGLALTFIRNLVADLEDALPELADVFTFHGFCKHQLHRNPVEGLQGGWDYYPPLLELLAEDLRLVFRPAMTKAGIEGRLHDLDESDTVVGEALALGNYYNAVSHTDLVYRVLRHLESYPDTIPDYPLIVVDEYQDFSELETSFITLLSTTSPVLIAGDDDQALYAFKGASPRFIRQLAEDDGFEKFELPFCSRCPQVIVEAVNDAIRAAGGNGNLIDRIDKPFQCYLPDKQPDSEAHPRIIHARCSVERGNAPYVGRYVTDQIARIPIDDVHESHANAYPTVLVVGPNPFLKRAHDVIREQFSQATLKTSDQPTIEPLDGYRRLARDEASRLGWRIMIHCDPFEGAADALREALANENELSALVRAGYRDEHLDIAALVRRLLDDEQPTAAEEDALQAVMGMPLDAIQERPALTDADDRGDEGDGVDADAPTIICTSLVGAKGLSAAYVFVVGFNSGHLPRDPGAITDEEVCCFLVALSRTRKECHLVSCRRLGNEQLQPSAFAQWVRRHLDVVTVDAAYFRNR